MKVQLNLQKKRRKSDCDALSYERQQNSELQQKLKSEVSKNENLQKQFFKEKEEFQIKVNAYKCEKEQLKLQIREVEQKMTKEKKEFQSKMNGYATLNFELQMELRAEKSETEKLKLKNLELERRIAMLHNADNVSEFAQDDHKISVKQEIKSESENGLDSKSIENNSPSVMNQ